MAESKKDKNTVVCDQCGEEISQDDDRVVFALSKGFHLCSDCAQELVVNYRDAVKRHKTANSIKKNNKLTPSSILVFIKRYVIGQDAAAKILALAVYNHYKKLRYLQQHKDQKDAVELQKSNIMLLGISGSGKSHLVKTIARFLNVPYTIESATNFSSTGFVGKDVDQIIQSLVLNAEGKDITEKVQRAEMGIVYIDEFDKLSRKGESPSISKDVGGEAVQQALLTLIEGSNVDVSVTRGQRITPTTQTVKVNTENILFICGGSFEGIERIILKRLHEGKSSMGFGAPLKATDKNKTDVLLSVTQEDIKQFGIIPEILGRLPILCPLRDLTVSDLVDILTKPKNALVLQYKELFKMDGSTLEITEEALKKIATLALQKGTGARALRTVLEETLAPVMFDLPENPAAVKVALAAVSDNPDEDKLTIIKEPLEGACGAP